MSALVNYNNKIFKAISTSENSEIDDNLEFLYVQKGIILSCSYAGKNIRSGNLLGTVAEDGSITMVYHQITNDGKIMTGKCISTPEVLENGKIKLHEEWQWTNGNRSKGNSILLEQ